MTNCTVTNCKNEAYGQTSYCSKHYQRMYKHGTLETIINREHSAFCGVTGCNRKYYAKGLCSKHYKSTDAYILYSAWDNMHKRCESPSYKYFKDYGARGIKVCDRWSGKDGLNNFLEDVGRKPSPKHTLDRKNNDGNYEPGNVRWATPTEQAHNKRVQSNNKSGVSGVNWDKRSGKWRVLLQNYGKVHWIGLFENKEDAINARRRAERDLL